MDYKIKEFLFDENPNLSYEENLRIQNKSDHNVFIHQAIFNAIERFTYRVIRDIFNTNSNRLFEDNHLNIISDEKTIEEVIVSSLSDQGHTVKSLNNPEMIYRAYNFIKPDNLLPKFNEKLYLIQKLGITEENNKMKFVINPYFFGFKISFDIFINSLMAYNADETMEDGLKTILRDKYGEEYERIYDYVSYICKVGSGKGQKNGDQADETFIEYVQAISGINDDKIFYNFIYESAMITSTEHAKIIGDQLNS